MRKALTITLVAALALFAGSAAYANFCARDVVPASTLLVPYAVQDMTGPYTADGNNYTTILTVTNVSKDAQIIHITVWSAVSEAVLDFNEVLTGYDVWQIYFRDMFNNNFANFDTSRSSTASPNTGNRDPFEWGPDGRTAYNSFAALPTPDSTTVLPYGLPGTNCTKWGPPYGSITTSVLHNAIDHIRAPLHARDHAGCGGLTIRGGFDTDWLGSLPSPAGVSPLWYYVTVDVVKDCNTDFPNTTNYFTSWYKEANVLIGDIIYLASEQRYSEAISAVHIESNLDGYQVPNHFYDPGANPSFDLEPLATAFAFNYYDIPTLGIQTNALLWKNYSDFFSSEPSIDDCGYYMYYNWDQDEHTNSRSGACRVSPCSENNIDPNEFPFETQSVPVTRVNFDLVAEQGWMLIIFPPSYGSFTDPTTSANMKHPSDVEIQAWVGTKIVYGNYSMSLEAATMANAHCFSNQVLPQLGVSFVYDPPTE